MSLVVVADVLVMVRGEDCSPFRSHSQEVTRDVQSNMEQTCDILVDIRVALRRSGQDCRTVRWRALRPGISRETVQTAVE